MTQMFRDRARFLRSVADAAVGAVSPAMTGPIGNFGFTFDDDPEQMGTQLAQAPTVSSLQAPTNCPQGTSPTASVTSIGANLGISIGGVTVTGGGGYANATAGCAPIGGATGAPAPGSGGGPTSSSPPAEAPGTFNGGP